MERDSYYTKARKSALAALRQRPVCIAPRHISCMCQRCAASRRYLVPKQIATLTLQVGIRPGKNNPLFIAVEPDGSDSWRLDPIVDLLKGGAVRFIAFCLQQDFYILILQGISGRSLGILLGSEDGMSTL